MSKFYTKLRKTIKQLGGTQVIFAERIGVTQPVLNKLLQGRTAKLSTHRKVFEYLKTLVKAGMLEQQQLEELYALFMTDVKTKLGYVQQPNQDMFPIVTGDDISRLRQETGGGLMACKRLLTEHPLDYWLENIDIATGRTRTTQVGMLITKGHL